MPAVLGASLSSGLAGLWQSQRCSPQQNGACEPRVGPPVTRHTLDLDGSAPAVTSRRATESMRESVQASPRSVACTMVDSQIYPIKGGATHALLLRREVTASFVFESD